MKKIYIDAGHGGNDSGAVNGSRKEKDDVLKLALMLENEFKQIKEVSVKLSRKGDITLSLTNRIKEANAWGAAYYISLHRNAASANAAGNEAWVISTATKKTISKAKIILEEVCKIDNLPNRGVKLGAANYSDYAVNKETKMPSVLLELGFITNNDDNKVFDKHIKNYAKAIAKALCKILDVECKNIVLGDVDGDGKITAKDARQALRAAASLENLTEEQKKAADINKDGKITAKDAREILIKSTNLN